MELSNIEVRLAGDLNHVVPKVDVTPAEIILLRAIHGDDAVINVRPTRMDKRTHASEFDRLNERYGYALGRINRSMETYWPGFDKKLPIKLSDIGVNPAAAPAPIPVAAIDDDPNVEEADDHEEVAA